MKSYQHVKTNHIARLSTNDERFYYISDLDAYLPIEMIEESSDWKSVADVEKETLRTFKTRIEHVIDSIFKFNTVYIGAEEGVLRKVEAGEFKGEFFKRLKATK
jgi:hypothetical protein